MKKGKDSGIVLASGSKQYFDCPRLNATGPVSIDHLVDQKIYSMKNKECRKCGVCEASLNNKAPAPNVVPIASSSRKRKESIRRPHGRPYPRMVAVRR